MTNATQPVWRARLPHALGIVVAAAIVEALLYRFFLESSYYHEMFVPVAALVVLMALAALWRALRPRDGDRRDHDRRHTDRRHR